MSKAILPYANKAAFHEKRDLRGGRCSDIARSIGFLGNFRGVFCVGLHPLWFSKSGHLQQLK